MEQYYEVINKLLPLLSTMEEGVLHVNKQIQELRYEEALAILRDILEGIDSIENAIKSIKDELELDGIDTLSILVKESIEYAVSNYEKGNQSNLLSWGGEKLLPSFANWKDEIERVIRPYILC